MKIISISGLDGSGKSTQAKLLQEFLEKHGKKVFYFHAVQFSLPQKIKVFSNKLCFFLHHKQNMEKIEEKSITSANRLQIQLRKIAFLIDIIRFHFLKRNLTKKGYDFLVTDRYFYDNIVNIAYLEGKNPPASIEKYIPPADMAFYLKIEPESIMTRDRIPDQGLKYLKAKKRLYDMYGTLWNFKIIDGSAPQQILFEKIILHLSNKQHS